jgi:hypothetical protein
MHLYCAAVDGFVRTNEVFTREFKKILEMEARIIGLKHMAHLKGVRTVRPSGTHKTNSKAVSI